MTLRIVIKLLFLVFGSALTALLTYATITHNIPIKLNYDNRETIAVESYFFGKTPPVMIGSIKNSDRAYIHIKLRFRGSSTEGFPNLFQTAPVNSGMRMEISGSSAAIVVPDTTVSGGLKGLTIFSGLKTGQWYELEIEALNGEYIRAKLDGKRVADFASEGLNFETSQIIVGSGFDASRTFRGEIENISVTKGNLPSRFYYFSFCLISAIIFIALLVKLWGMLARNKKIIVAMLYMRQIQLKLTKFNFYIGLGAVILAIVVYNSMYFNRYFPVTEGWFSAYAHLIRQGYIPYRDFYFFLTPLYPIQIAAFQSVFGESFIALRVLGIVIVLLLSLFLYLILVRRFSPLASTIATVTAIFYYQSGVAHISYDFIQFFNVYVLAATYLIIRFSDHEYVGKTGKRNNASTLLILAGVMVSLAFLTKQSNGSLVVLFSVLAVMLAMSGQNFSFLLRNISIYMLGMALPVLIALIWLYFVNALPQFIDQVVFGAIASKGTISNILFSWIGRFINEDLLIHLKVSIFYLSPLIILSLIGTAIVKWQRKKGAPPLENVSQILVFIVLFCFVVGISYFGNILSESLMWLINLKNFLLQEIIAVSTIVTVFIALTAIIQLIPSVGFIRKDLAISATMTLGLIFGNGTSAGIGEVSTYLSFALVLSFLISLPNSHGIAKVLTSGACLSLILVLAAVKFQQPYAWWYVSEPDVRKSTSSSTLPLLAGLRLSPDTLMTIEEVVQSIKAHSSPGDDIFAFPNIPGFYAFTDRWPHSKVIVPWFDFLPDLYAQAEANRLKAFPPVIIVNLKLPEEVWVLHESLFRNGRPLGQRNIKAAIEELTEQRKLYQLDTSREVSPGCVLEVWHKRMQ
jgi:hypothetical protein